MLKICKCCHTEYATPYQKSVYCSDPCRTFYQTVAIKFPQEMLEDAALLSSEGDYKLFIRSYFYMKNGNLNYQLLASPLLPSFLKVDPLKYANLHNNEDSVNYRVLRWLYDVNPSECITCGKPTSLEIKKSIPSYRKYCSEECYTESMKVGGEARKVLDQVVHDKYGVDNVFRLEHVKDKSKETMLERHGVVYPMESAELRRKHVASLQKNYNVSVPLHNPEIQQRLFNTLGARSWYDTPAGKLARQKSYATYPGGHPMRDPSVLSKMVMGFSIQSEPERQICEWLGSIGVSFSHSKWNILAGMKFEDGSHHRQIDIYCPDHKLAIEFNGLYWHSEEHKYRRYHLEKTNGCESKGIQLVHIWEDEWRDKPEVVKGMLMAKLGVSKPKSYARKCVVVEGNKSDSIEFLDKLHIQGSVNSATHYLYLKDKKIEEIRAVMLFMKRIVAGVPCMELVRFAADNCHGAFSKLLSYYKTNLQQGMITYSFGDRSVVSRISNVYLSNGFIETEIQKPDYKYLDKRFQARHHKFGFRKEEFERLGYDIEGKTESQLAKEAGLVRIWNSGLIRYELTFNKPSPAIMLPIT